MTDAPKPYYPNADEVTVQYAVLSHRAITWWAVLITVIGIGMAVWLLLAYGRGDPQVQLDAIRTAGTVVVGTGGAAALLLAARRQRTTEIALKQKDRDQADAARAHALQERIAAETRTYQERVAAATEADAEARRITDLYTKAADQLGSEKAPVRLAGLYAMERLAQDNPNQRQTIVNVLCAYLRMPYTVPGILPAEDADGHLYAAYRDRVQEREARLTAQRILTQHLRPGDDPGDPTESFWADIDLDLTGAILIDFDLTGCVTRDARFTQATFIGHARFVRSAFTSITDFSGASFSHLALFNDTTFNATKFEGTVFTGTARFEMATFAGHTSFSRAKFTGDAEFGYATFGSSASFDAATFNSEAMFRRATFANITHFNGATITGNARFNRAVFSSDAHFANVTLPSTIIRATDINLPPSPWTNFVGASFERVPREVAQFLSPPEDDR